MELLPCPFCGGKAVEERPHRGVSVVYCRNIGCPVHANTGWCDESEESAASLWNTRANPPMTTERER